MTRGQDQQHRLLYELCALVFSILRSLSLEVPWSDALPQEPATVSRPSSAAAGRPRVSAAGLASLLLGLSLSLMLCGSVTFVIGFMLMPWVIGVVMLFYFVGLVSSLSMLGRSIFCSTLVSPRSPLKEMPGTVSRPDKQGRNFMFGSEMKVLYPSHKRPDCLLSKEWSGYHNAKGYELGEVTRTTSVEMLFYWSKKPLSASCYTTR